MAKLKKNMLKMMDTIAEELLSTNKSMFQSRRLRKKQKNQMNLYENLLLLRSIQKK
jgi:hypothetical protein